jgi:hypothetical protein
MLRRRHGSTAAVLLMFMRFSRSSSLVSVLLAAACATGVDIGPEGLAPYLTDAGLSADDSRGGKAGSTGRSGTSSYGAGGDPSTNAGAGGASLTTTAGSGGTNGAGPPTRDAAGAGGAIAIDSATGCVSTQKACGGRCVLPNASVGCSLTGCDSCPIGPSHSLSKCTGNQCDFDCLSGYQRSGPSCVVSEGGVGGSGGSDGGGGSQGDGGPGGCSPAQCGGCIPVIQAPCCKSDHTCGCQYPFAACT